MNKLVSFGVLLFSYALVMLAFQPGEPVRFTIPEFPTANYRVLGIIAIVLSLAFLVMATRKGWSEWAEKILGYRWVYGIWSIIFEGLYILSFLRGYIEVHKAALPVWLDNTVFYFGFALAVYIPIIVSKYYPKKKIDTNPPPDKQKTE